MEIILPSRWLDIEAFQEIDLDSLPGGRDDDPDALGVRRWHVRVVGRADVEVGLIGRQQDAAAAAEGRLPVPREDLR